MSHAEAPDGQRGGEEQKAREWSHVEEPLGRAKWIVDAEDTDDGEIGHAR